MWAPGSAQWMRWFQSSPGNQPMDRGTIAFDYDMVFAFKSLPVWQKATTGVGRGLTTRRGAILVGGTYNGRGLDSTAPTPLGRSR